MNWNPFKSISKKPVQEVKPYVQPPELKAVDWTDQDAIIYKNFMSSLVGKKIQKHHDNYMISLAMDTCLEAAKPRDYLAGICVGLIKAGTQRDLLCQTQAEREAAAKKAAQVQDERPSNEQVQGALNTMAKGGRPVIEYGD